MTPGRFPHTELLALGRFLRDGGYRFTSVTPDTHESFLQRAPRRAGDARAVLGWNMPFVPSELEPRLFELMVAAQVCPRVSPREFRATLRCSTLEDLLFFHSRFPTSDVDSVFFGPDSYRFVRALRARVTTRQTYVVDIGCGAGVGGIALARAVGIDRLLLTDVNPAALHLAAVNAELNDVRAELVLSDVLTEVKGSPELVIANPPYLADPAKRLYRDGGGSFGSELSVRIAREASARLSENGGRLLLYSGAAVVDGRDQLRAALEPVLRQAQATFAYEEIDPDVFGADLATPGYAQVERIAAVLLDATVPRSVSVAHQSQRD
jgi:methylase of polypeptide subunit release factors